MEIDGRVIIYGILIIVILLLLLVSFGVINLNFGKTTGTGNTANSEYGNMPEKCRPPSGESISAWKEHLGHHADTQECLSYFN